MTSRARQFVFSALLSAVASSAAFAQADSSVRFDASWRALLGCWANAGSPDSPGSFCVVPTRDPHTIEVVSVLGDSIISRTALTATGARILRMQDGCAGFERGTWSADTHRLFTHAEYACAGGQKVSLDGLFTMITPTRFARIEAVPVAGGSTVRVRMYELRTDVTKIPASIASRLPSVQSDVAVAARSAATENVTPSAVAEAATLVESPVVDSWLAMRGQLFGLTSADTRSLRQAHVSEGTITAMVSGYGPAAPSAPRAADFTALNDAQRGLGNGLSIGDGEFAFREYAPRWLFQMGSANGSYSSYRANTPCFGAPGCYGLYDASGEFFVKHRPLAAPARESQTVTDNASMSGSPMSLQTPNSTAMLPSASAPTITGKP